MKEFLFSPRFSRFDFIIVLSAFPIAEAYGIFVAILIVILLAFVSVFFEKR